MKATLPDHPASNLEVPADTTGDISTPISNAKSQVRIAWPHVVLGLLGIGVSLYSVYLHNVVKAGGDACGSTATINCNSVLASRWAVIAGVPLGYYGALFFAIVIITAISTLPLTTPQRQIVLPRFLLATCGLLGSIALTLISIFDIGSLCKVCLATHSVTLTNFLVASWALWKAGKGAPKVL